MNKVINCNIKHENAGVYRVRARLTTPKTMNPTTLKKIGKKQAEVSLQGGTAGWIQHAAEYRRYGKCPNQ